MAHDHYHRGLTLIEVMIALMIFSLGILAVVSMQSRGIRSTAMSRQRLCDTTAMVRQLELLMALDFDHDLLADGDFGFDPDHPDHGPYNILESGSFLEWEVADNLPVAGAKQIQVSVHRKGLDGLIRGFSFNCLKAGELPAPGK